VPKAHFISKSCSVCFSSSSVLFSEIWIGVETLELNQAKVKAEANA